MHVYEPDKYQIAIGLPPASVNIENWVRMTPSKPTARFNYMEGVVDGEPFIEMVPSTSRVFNLLIFQTSPQVKNLWDLFTLQLTGLGGFPFSIIDNGTDTDQTRPKSFYPVSFILDEPEAVYELTASAWLFRIQVAGGATAYI